MSGKKQFNCTLTEEQFKWLDENCPNKTKFVSNCINKASAGETIERKFVSQTWGNKDSKDNNNLLNNYSLEALLPLTLSKLDHETVKDIKKYIVKKYPEQYRTFQIMRAGIIAEKEINHRYFLKTECINILKHSTYISIVTAEDCDNLKASILSKTYFIGGKIMHFNLEDSIIKAGFFYNVVAQTFKEYLKELNIASEVLSVGLKPAEDEFEEYGYELHITVPVLTKEETRNLIGNYVSENIPENPTKLYNFPLEV